jgi:hypothetical protein
MDRSDIGLDPLSERERALHNEVVFEPARPSDLITVSDAARELGLRISEVEQAARERGQLQGFDSADGGAQLLVSTAFIERLARRYGVAESASGKATKA